MASGTCRLAEVLRERLLNGMLNGIDYMQLIRCGAPQVTHAIQRATLHVQFPPLFLTMKQFDRVMLGITRQFPNARSIAIDSGLHEPWLGKEWAKQWNHIRHERPAVGTIPNMQHVRQLRFRLTLDDLGLVGRTIAAWLSASHRNQSCLFPSLERLELRVIDIPNIRCSVPENEHVFFCQGPQYNNLILNQMHMTQQMPNLTHFFTANVRCGTLGYFDFLSPRQPLPSTDCDVLNRLISASLTVTDDGQWQQLASLAHRLETAEIVYMNDVRTSLFSIASFPPNLKQLTFRGQAYLVLACPLPPKMTHFECPVHDHTAKQHLRIDNLPRDMRFLSLPKSDFVFGGVRWDVFDWERMWPSSLALVLWDATGNEPWTNGHVTEAMALHPNVAYSVATMMPHMMYLLEGRPTLFRTVSNAHGDVIIHCICGLLQAPFTTDTQIETVALLLAELGKRELSRLPGRTVRQRPNSDEDNLHAARFAWRQHGQRLVPFVHASTVRCAVRFSKYNSIVVENWTKAWFAEVRHWLWPGVNDTTVFHCEDSMGVVDTGRLTCLPATSLIDECTLHRSAVQDQLGNVIFRCRDFGDSMFSVLSLLPESVTSLTLTGNTHLEFATQVKLLRQLPRNLRGLTIRSKGARASYTYGQAWRLLVEHIPATMRQYNLIVQHAEFTFAIMVLAYRWRRRFARKARPLKMSVLVPFYGMQWVDADMRFNLQFSSCSDIFLCVVLVCFTLFWIGWALHRLTGALGSR